MRFRNFFLVALCTILGAVLSCVPGIAGPASSTFAYFGLSLAVGSYALMFAFAAVGLLIGLALSAI